MATANPANAIEFGKFNYGAALTTFTVTAAADVSGEVNPGEEIGQIIKQYLSTELLLVFLHTQQAEQYFQ